MADFEVLQGKSDCATHDKLIGVIGKLQDKVSDLAIEVEGLKKGKIGYNEFMKMTEKIQEFELLIGSMQNSLTEIKNNAEEDREILKDLIGELSLINKELSEIKYNYSELKKTNDKIDLFLETSLSFQIGKLFKQFGRVVDNIRNRGLFFKWLIRVVQALIFLFIGWGIYTGWLYFTKQTVDIDRIMEFIKLFTTR